MKLTPPTKLVFWISIIAAVLGIALWIVGLVTQGAILSIIGVVVLALAFLVLVLGLVLKGF